MLKDFDKAFTRKIKNYYSNTFYANTAIVYNVAYNLVNDPQTVLKFPMISIYRPTGFERVDNQNFSARKQGVPFYAEDSNTYFARFLTVNLIYQLDIYAKSPETLDDITQEVMLALDLDSMITVKQYDHDSKTYYEEDYEITYNNGPTEQSEFQSGDRVYHYAITYQIDNAKLLNFRKIKDIEGVEVGLELEDLEEAFTIGEIKEPEIEEPIEPGGD